MNYKNKINWKGVRKPLQDVGKQYWKHNYGFKAKWNIIQNQKIKYSEQDKKIENLYISLVFFEMVKSLEKLIQNSFRDEDY